NTREDCYPYYGRLPPIEESFDDTTSNWIMADGGKVKLGPRNWATGSAGGVSAEKITDPYGQEITIEHDTLCQGCGTQNRLKKVTDVGSGKYLEFTYYAQSYYPVGSPAGLGLIQKVEAKDRNGTVLARAEYQYHKDSNDRW